MLSIWARRLARTLAMIRLAGTPLPLTSATTRPTLSLGNGMKS